jgi:hypothetical protein
VPPTHGEASPGQTATVDSAVPDGHTPLSSSAEQKIGPPEHPTTQYCAGSQTTPSWRPSPRNRVGAVCGPATELFLARIAAKAIHTPSTSETLATRWHAKVNAFTLWGMASTPAHPLPASAPASLRKDEVRAALKDEPDRRPHQERVRASMEWALDEYATTLAKLAK